MNITELQDRQAVLIAEINLLAPQIFGQGKMELMPQLDEKQKELFAINIQLSSVFNALG